jgi:hypothetical protein
MPVAQYATLLIFNVALALMGGFIFAWLTFALSWYRWFR